MPNYRGGFGHGEEFAASVRGDMGGAEWRDVLAAVDAAVERGIADPDRLGVGGWSQGGFLTAWAVTRTDRFKAGVMGAGVSDWGAMALMSDVPSFEATLAGDSPWDHPGPHRGAERSPMSYSSRRATPLFILHGQNDERVPPQPGHRVPSRAAKSGHVGGACHVSSRTPWNSRTTPSRRPAAPRARVVPTLDRRIMTAEQ